MVSTDASVGQVLKLLTSGFFVTNDGFGITKNAIGGKFISKDWRDVSTGLV